MDESILLRQLGTEWKSNLYTSAANGNDLCADRRHEELPAKTVPNFFLKCFHASPALKGYTAC
jgi:hypothetical protein